MRRSLMPAGSLDGVTRADARADADSLHLVVLP